MANLNHSTNNITVYLTSVGSKQYFPENDNSTFTNMLSNPLDNMYNFEVCMAACHISAPLPSTTILVCSNIVEPTFFNEKQMPIIGVYSPFYV